MAKDKSPPEAAEKVKQSWDDGLSTASPQRSMYFNAMRTDAFESTGLQGTYIQFWVALQVDPAKDLWRVEQYTVYNLDKPDGIFELAPGSQQDCSFVEAVYLLSRYSNQFRVFGNVKAVDMAVKYPTASLTPALKKILDTYYYAIAPYREVANILHVAFDERGQPYRTIEGKVFASAVFQHSEAARAISDPEEARKNSHVIARIEEGIMSDIFNSASAPGASLENELKAWQALAKMDEFAAYLGAFYVGIQQILGKDDKFSKIQGLAAEDSNRLYEQAKSLLPASVDIPGLLGTVLVRAANILSDAKAMGIYVEPFEKDLAECELYAHLLSAAQNRVKYTASMKAPSGANIQALAALQESVSKAKSKYTSLGGPVEHIDRIEARVANDTGAIPPSLVSWLSRYYDQRQKVVKKVEKRTADATRSANTMAAQVRPPLDPVAEEKKPEQAASDTVPQTPAPAAETPRKKWNNEDIPKI